MGFKKKVRGFGVQDPCLKLRDEVLNMSFRLGRNLSLLYYIVLYKKHYIKRIPAGVYPREDGGGNDRIREILNTKQSFEEFLD
jgi:hypothetical protein